MRDGQKNHRAAAVDSMRTQRQAFFFFFCLKASKPLLVVTRNKMTNLKMSRESE